MWFQCDYWLEHERERDERAFMRVRMMNQLLHNGIEFFRIKNCHVFCREMLYFFVQVFELGSQRLSALYVRFWKGVLTKGSFMLIKASCNLSASNVETSALARAMSVMNFVNESWITMCCSISLDMSNFVDRNGNTVVSMRIRLWILIACIDRPYGYLLCRDALRG